MRVREGTEASFALVSAGGWVVSTFDDKSEERARSEARNRGLALYKLSTVAERMSL